MELSLLTRNMLIYLIAKRSQLRAQRDRIRSLVLGSSHGDFGFDPDFCGDSFNLCSRSQDLQYAFHLYRQVGPCLPRMDNLVLFYSVFSSGSFLDKSPSETGIGPALNETFGLGINYDQAELAQIAASLEGQLHDRSFEIGGHCGFFPGFQKSFFDESYGVQRRADEHMKLNRKNDANVYLMQIFLLARALKHRPWVVIPPARQDYKDACGLGFDTLFSDLIEILDLVKMFYPDLQVGLINFYDDGDFKDEHFGDFDHLLPDGEGPKLLARKIDEIINRSTAAV